MSRFAGLSRSARIGAVCAGLCLPLASVGIGFGPLVRWLAARAAARRGFVVEIGAVRPGNWAVWLKDVEVQAPLVPDVKVHVESLRVGFDWRLGLRELALHGASVQANGDWGELEREIADYRASRPKTSGSGGDQRYLADGVDLSWRARTLANSAKLWGLRYQRQGLLESLGFDLACVDASGLELELRDSRMRLARVAERREIESLQLSALELGVTMEPPAQAEQTAHHERRRFHPEPERAAQVRAGLASAADMARRLLPDGAKLDLEGVRIRFQRGLERLNIGPSSLVIQRRLGEIEASLVPKAEASGTPLELRLALPLGRGDLRLELRGGPVSLDSLGIREGDFGLIGVRAATVRATGAVTLAPDAAELAFDGHGELDQLSLDRPAIAPRPLHGIDLTFQARGSAALDGSRFVLDDGELGLGEVRLRGKGELSRDERGVQTHWLGGVPLAACQAFLDATPRGLAPLIASLRMTGTFGVKAELAYNSLRPNDTSVRLDVMNDCRVSEIPADLSPRRFSVAWWREVKGADKQPMEIESGPGSPDWVPYDAISPFMEAAVMVCEDGHFERHHGFDYEAIQNSIKDNLIQGRFVRGASTITMQLAKNLYLSKEKTLGRKLQEAALTLLLEQELSKQQLMELYLNVIEYAPGIYGIGPAARYYFAKRPSELSLGQALYIASILPNPERQHFGKDGRVNAVWTNYLQRLMRIARKIGKITAEQLDAGLAEQVAFHVPGSGPPAPSPEDDTETPSELSPL